MENYSHLRNTQFHHSSTPISLFAFPFARIINSHNGCCHDVVIVVVTRRAFSQWFALKIFQ